jgi:hypothetical protein
MDTLLYVSQIILGVGVLVAALALSGRLPGRLGERVTPNPAYSEVRGSRCVFGFLLSVASIMFGAAGLAGLSVIPAPLGFVLTGMGLVSVVFATETTPMTYRVTVDEFSVLPVPRTNTEVIVTSRPADATAAAEPVHSPGHQVA